MPGERFTKRQAVIGNLLGVVTRLPFDMQEQVQPSAEVRAIRYWEEFDERIIRWWYRAIAAAVAGQFSAVAITGPVGPVGTLWTIDRVRYIGPVGGGTYRLRLGSSLAGLPNVFNPSYRDQRWGPSGAPAPITTLTGSNAAQSGALVDELSPVVGLEITPEFVGQLGSEPVTFWGDIVNQQIEFVVYGRIILPR